MPQHIFDAVVGRGMEHGLVDGAVLSTDSTRLKAIAKKGRFDKAVVAKPRASHREALDAAVDAKRAQHGQRPFKAKKR